MSLKPVFGCSRQRLEDGRVLVTKNDSFAEAKPASGLSERRTALVKFG